MRDITEAAGDGIRSIATSHPGQMLHSLALYGVIGGLVWLLYLEAGFDNQRERQLIDTLVSERAKTIATLEHDRAQTQEIVSRFVAHLSEQAPTKAGNELRLQLLTRVDNNAKELKEVRADVKRLIEIYTRYDGKTGR